MARHGNLTSALIVRGVERRSTVEVVSLSVCRSVRRSSMLEATTNVDVEAGDSAGVENASAASTETNPVPGRRRYVAGNLRKKPLTLPGTTATTQLSVNFDLVSPVADSDVRPTSDQTRSRFSRRASNVLSGARSKAASSGQYHMQPRRSLLGKPINFRAHRRDVKYRRLQNKIYNFLERPKDYPSISYHLIV